MSDTTQTSAQILAQIRKDVSSYPWMIEALNCIGIAEIHGPQTNPTISTWLQQLKAWWKDDETPWCGVFAAHCMQTAKLDYPKSFPSAGAWVVDWGLKLSKPITGSVVVFSRPGGHHVGFVIGESPDKRLLVVGGNQGDCVCIVRFMEDANVVGYFWPKGVSLPTGDAAVARQYPLNVGMSIKMS